MVGLVLVLLLLLMALFADFFAPMDPKEQGTSFSPPDALMFTAPDGSFSLIPKVYPIVDTDQLDPITFQPLTAPDMEHPIDLGFFVKGYSYKIFWLIPADIHFFGSTNGAPGPLPRHRQARPRHPLARHHRLAHLAHHRAGRGHASPPSSAPASASPRAISAAASTPGCSASSRSSSPSRNCRSIWR